jgi:MFS family permease
MVKKAIQILLKKRHFWRTVSFDELSELYASEFLRTLAMSVIGIFVPIYLYKLGYDLTDIFLMMVVWAITRPLFSYVAAKSIAALGPKHSMALGTAVQMVYLGVLVTIDSVNWPLALLSVLGSLSYALFGIALQVDFSKVKHTEHGGKEIGFITICGRVGASIGPLVGGVVASFVNPKATIVIALVILASSLVPLFKTAEPIKTNQAITLKGFPWRRHKRDFISAFFFGIENIVSIVIWPLFIALVIFQNNTYAAIGLLVSIGTAASLLAIYLIGKLIDNHRGGLLFKVGVYINSFIHLLRPFVVTPIQAISISLINEPVSASYQMPYMKGLYDAADSVPGYRIVYLTLIDNFRMLGLLLFWGGAFIASLMIENDISILKAMFVVGSIASLGILSQRFAALKS